MDLNKVGKVYLIGAGPGNPELLTRKAERLIRKADVILYDRLVNPFIIQMVSPGVEIIDVGKKPYHKHIQQEEINKLLVDAAYSHHCVVRLKGGDPAIFGRIHEEVSALNKQNIECEIVPGITSASAAVASMKQGLTARQIATHVTYTTGHFCKMNTDKVELDKLLSGGTLAIYMGIRNLKTMMREIYQQTKKDYPVVVIYNVSTYKEKLIQGTLTTIDQLIETQSCSFMPGVVLVGDLMAELPYVTSLSQSQTKSYLITGEHQSALEKALSLYSEGHFCLIDAIDTSIYHKTQIEFMNDIKGQYLFDEHIKLI